MLHLTVGRVRKHLLQEGKAEHWMIFEELALAPLIPGRVVKTREELLAMFPGEGPAFLDNRMTTVKRVFRRILPALIPADPTERLTAEERFEELVGILRASGSTRLWLAFLVDPTPDPEASVASSQELAAPSVEAGGPEATISPDMLHDELRILLGFWLEMPLWYFSDAADGKDADIPAAARPARPSGPAGRPPADPPLNLKSLIDATRPLGPAVTTEELTVLLERLKTFAKRVHRPAAQAGRRGASSGRLENSMPFEIAQVLYNLAGALALTRCEARIIGLSDDRFRKNIAWALHQSWLDPRLRPVFSAALSQLHA